MAATGRANRYAFCPPLNANVRQAPLRGDMDEVNVLQTVKARQRVWAANLGIDLDRDGYCTTLEQNLFHPLSKACRAEIGGGDGSELGKAGARGKIQAFHTRFAESGIKMPVAYRRVALDMHNTPLRIFEDAIRILIIEETIKVDE